MFGSVWANFSTEFPQPSHSHHSEVLPSCPTIHDMYKSRAVQQGAQYKLARASLKTPGYQPGDSPSSPSASSTSTFPSPMATLLQPLALTTMAHLGFCLGWTAGQGPCYAGHVENRLENNRKSSFLMLQTRSDQKWTSKILMSLTPVTLRSGWALSFLSVSASGLRPD